MVNEPIFFAGSPQNRPLFRGQEFLAFLVFPFGPGEKSDRNKVTIVSDLYDTMAPFENASCNTCQPGWIRSGFAFVGSPFFG